MEEDTTRAAVKTVFLFPVLSYTNSQLSHLKRRKLFARGQMRFFAIILSTSHAGHFFINKDAKFCIALFLILNEENISAKKYGFSLTLVGINVFFAALLTTTTKHDL